MYPFYCILKSQRKVHLKIVVTDSELVVPDVTLITSIINLKQWKHILTDTCDDA